MKQYFAYLLSMLFLADVTCWGQKNLETENLISIRFGNEEYRKLMALDSDSLTYLAEMLTRKGGYSTGDPVLVFAFCVKYQQYGHEYSEQDRSDMIDILLSSVKGGIGARMVMNVETLQFIRHPKIIDFMAEFEAENQSLYRTLIEQRGLRYEGPIPDLASVFPEHKGWGNASEYTLQGADSVVIESKLLSDENVTSLVSDQSEGVVDVRSPKGLDEASHTQEGSPLRFIIIVGAGLVLASFVYFKLLRR